MKSSAWNWSEVRSRNRYRPGPGWLRPFTLAVPWVTVLTLAVMLWLIGGTFTAAEGVLFDLPEGDLAEGDPTSLVALMLPSGRDTLVFFDDARYTLGDRGSLAAFGEHLAGRVEKSGGTTLVVLADRRVTGGDLSKLAGVARWGGVKKLLFANRRKELSAE